MWRARSLVLYLMHHEGIQFTRNQEVAGLATNVALPRTYYIIVSSTDYSFPVSCQKNKVAWHRIELGTMWCRPDAIQIKIE
jgi:hypothetical protein